MNPLKDPTFFIMLLLIFAILPRGIVSAGPNSQDSVSTPTPTAAPVTPAPPATPFVSSAIPGLLNADIPAQISELTDLLTFEDFGFDEITLHGPFATNDYYFDLPFTWQVKAGARLRLDMETYYTNIASDSENLSTPVYGGSLLVQYNYVTIASIDLNQQGPQQIDLPIPIDALDSSEGSDGSSIRLILDSGINCDVNFRTTVIIRSSSELYLPHDFISPPVDLRLLPSPFYQNSFNQDSVIIIVPDQPTAGELQAALSISAGLGRMTFNQLLAVLVPISQVPSDALADNNLIFVGRAAGLPLLREVKLSVPISAGMFVWEDSSSTDGIIQMAVSPWNKNKVVMVAGGNEDVGVINAARAISTNMLQVGANSSLSIVSNVQSVAPLFNPVEANQTFDDLGYESIVLSQVGLNVIQYTFGIPQNYTLGPDAYLDLVFSHTSLLEYQRSSIVVKLNNEPIGSARLSEETAGQSEAKILLPASAVRPGSNNLKLEITLEPQNECVNPLLEGLWLRVDSSSTLHMPFIPNPASSSIVLDLGRYPSPFAFDPVMNDLAFVLAPNDPVGWNVASQIAFALGNTTAIQLAGLEAFYADSVAESAKQERNLIIVGRPSKLNILSDLYDFLPAPFAPATDLAIQKNLQVSYHLEEGVDIGYIELLTAPWNSKRTILYVGGSSDLGVQWAGASLQFGRLRSKLNGNLAFINGEQVLTADTRILQGVQGVLATAVPAGDLTTDIAELEPQMAERPSWIMPTIFIALGGILLVLVVVGIQARLRKRSNK